MKLQLTWLRAFCAYSVLMFPVAALAVVVDAPINVDTTWSSVAAPYVIQANVAVERGATLTIEPGVQVQFAGAYTLNIIGTLIASGTAQKNIVFTAQDNNGVAARLMFTGDDAVFQADGVYKSGSILDYAVVEKIGGPATFGAVMLSGTSPYIRNCVIRNNNASGIYAYLITGNLRLEDNVIENNSAMHGGGLFVLTQPKAIVTIRGNTIRNNAVSGDSGSSGGGAFVTAQGATANITSNIVRNNQASFSGGGMALNGLGTHSFVLSGNVIRDNRAATGGGVSTSAVTLAMTGETIGDNTAESKEGGGLYLHESQATVSKSMILRNRSAKMGGGIFLNAGTYTFTDNVLALNDSGAHGGGIDMHGLPDVTLDHSVIAGNKAKDYGAGVSMTEGFGRIFNSAIVANESANTIGIFKISELQGNTIAYNSAESPRYSGSTIAFDPTDPNASLVMAENNIFRNATKYEVFSNFDGAINAPNNWWGTADETAIAARQALVRFGASVDTSFLRAVPYTNAPISPPSGLTVIPTATSIKLLWNANPESDIGGYRVYWGSKPFPDYEYVEDVSSVTNYVIPHDLPSANGFIAVSAYDVDYVATNDDVLTPVNENQTRGHESWYALPSRAIKVVADPEKHQKQGDLVYFRITVTNTGPSVGDKEFIVTLRIAEGVSYYNGASLTNHGLPSICTLATERVVTCTHAVLKPDEKSEEILIPVKVTATGSADVVSTVTVHPFDYGPYTNPAKSQAQVTMHVNVPDVQAVWSSVPAANVKVGETVKYQVTVKNNGRVPAPGVLLNVTIPTLFTINALDARCTAAAINSTQIACNLGDLAGSGKAELVFSLSANAAGDATLIAVGVTDGDSDTTNNEDRIVTTIDSGVVQGSGDSGSGVVPPAAGKRGGGVIDLAWLLMLLPWVVVRHRAHRSTV